MNRTIVMMAFALGVAAELSAQTPLASASASAPSASAAERLLARSVTIDVTHASLKRAIDAVATSAGVFIQYRAQTLDAYAKDVTLHLSHVPLGVALERIFLGTSLHVTADGISQLNVVEMDDGTRGGGQITGTVVDGHSQRPMSGVMVTLDDATRGVVTGGDGSFRLAGVAAGEHRVSMRVIGYVRQTQTVRVNDGETATVRFVLSQSATPLDQVVVTGTVIPTELKAVPNAITVITAKQIEERGITRIDQLFRGDVPGVYVQNSGSSNDLDRVAIWSRGTTYFNFASPNFGSGNLLKTYVDGVELANPAFLSQIDPKSIERIEILTGPQASTIYGSNALNGVMQVFTKRGTSTRPQLTMLLTSGWVQSNFSNGLAPQHDYSTQISGTEGQVSYNAGGSWNYIGPWTPAKQTARLSGFGGSRLQWSHTTADVSLRLGTTTNQKRGASDPVSTLYRTLGIWSPNTTNGLVVPTYATLQGTTFGATVTYLPFGWWSNQVTIGRDVSNTETRSTERGYQFPGDTLLSLTQSTNTRQSLQYITTIRTNLTTRSQTVITAGIDGWQNQIGNVSLSAPTLTGTIAGTPSVNRQPGHNRGSFVQGQLGLIDAFFLTYGLRAEWNPTYGDKSQPSFAPRYGAAYTRQLGNTTAKVRASYGRATRPPAVGQKSEIAVAPTNTVLIASYGNYLTQFGNPDLEPEQQQGGEGGVELYFGTRGSLILTRYNQTVNHLISTVSVDSVRSIVPNPPGLFCSSKDINGYCYAVQSQFVNVGNIRNHGWEGQGTATVKSLTIKGTYSFTKSRLIGVDQRYSTFFTPQNGFSGFYKGSMLNLVPEHTWSVGLTYTTGQDNITLTTNGIGSLYLNTTNDERYWSSCCNRLTNDRPLMNVAALPRIAHPAYSTLDLNLTHRFRRGIDGLGQVQNLTNYYQNDYDPRGATLGRQVKVGVRVMSP